jgi:hypothetical protein
VRTERPRELGGAVARAVVDHYRTVVGGHAAEHPGQGAGLVEHGKDHVDHGGARG